MKNKLFVNLKQKGIWPKPNREARRLGQALQRLEDLSNEDKKKAAAIINSYVAIFGLSQRKRNALMIEVKETGISKKKELN